MGIFNKLSTVIKSNINDLISRAENPEKMLNQIILDMRDQLAKAKREVAAAIADERKLKAQLEQEVKQQRDWQHRAMLAAKEGRDDLAKQALLRQQEHAERAAVLQQTWEAQAAETEKLKGSLRQLNDKIEEEERRSVAQAEVNAELGGDTLESEFLRLEAGPGGADVEDQLLALKAEMGLIAAPAAEAPKQLEAGDDDGVAAGADGIAEAEVHEVEAEEVSDAEADAIPEAELLSEFDKLEKSAEG